MTLFGVEMTDGRSTDTINRATFSSSMICVVVPTNIINENRNARHLIEAVAGYTRGYPAGYPRDTRGDQDFEKILEDQREFL